MALNFKLAEIILESKPDRFWKILKQIGVNDAVGVLPRNYNDWRNSTEDEPWDYYPMMKYKNMLQESGLNLIAIEDNPPMNGIMYGNSDREKEIDYISKMIENILDFSIIHLFQFFPSLEGLCFLYPHSQSLIHTHHFCL